MLEALCWSMLPLVLSLLLASPASYLTELQKYRRDRVAELTAPNGWLAVAGLYWLHEGSNTAGSEAGLDVELPARAPKRLGAFIVSGRSVAFAAERGETVLAGGKPVGEFTFDPSKGEQSAIVTNGLTMFVIRRGDKLGIRLLDPQSDERVHFKGLRYFPTAPAFHVHARFTPYASPKKVPVPNVLGQIVQMESPGYVTFTLRGREYRLEPVYETSEKKDLFFIFKDRTSERETYGAGRFLHAPLPAGGIVDLDFNRAYNPPCAFTAYATCPLPVKENQLPVRIEAGELRYEHAGDPRP